MTPCPSPELLQRLLADQLSAAEEADANAHVEDCPHCQQFMEAWTTLAATDAAAPSSARPDPEGAGPGATNRTGEEAIGGAELRRLRSLLDPETPASATEPAAALPVPADWPVVPGYEVLGELGRGGMGVVYKARQLRLNRLVALKLVRADAAVAPAQRPRILVEGEALARLQHPNVVQIHDIGFCRGQAYFALELVEGGSLAARLGGKPLPAREVARLVACLAQAAQAAHAQNIVHRDLKPANVLLTADGVPKLTDFGLAKTLDVDLSLTRTGEVLGTPAYMAPEQALGRAEQVGPLTDVYALGVILYEMLTGRPPFLAASYQEVLQQVSWHEPVSPRRLQPEVPRDLETICLRCLQKEPRKRYASAGELADDVRRFLDNRAILARPSGLFEKLARTCRRNPLPASLLAGIVVVFATAFVLVSWSYFRAENAFEEEARQKQEARLAEQAADRARKEAEGEAAVSREIADFLSGLFEEADPFVPTGRIFGEQPLVNPTALDIVNRGARKLADPNRFKEKPLVRATLLDKVGHVYLSLGEGAKAAPFVSEALELRRKHLPVVHADLASSLHNAGLLYAVKWNMKKSKELFAAAHDMRSELFGKESPQAMTSRYHLAYVLVALNDPAAEPLLLEACEYQRARLSDAEKRRPEAVGPEALELGATLIGLCNLHAARNHFFQALPYVLEAQQVFKKVSNQELTRLADHFVNYRRAQAFGQVDQADKALRQALELIKKYTGTYHFIYLALERERAILFFNNDRYQEAEKAFLALEANYRRSVGEDGQLLADLSYEIARSIARGSFARAQKAGDLNLMRAQAARVEQFARAAYQQGKKNRAEMDRLGIYAVFLAYTLLLVKPESDDVAAEQVAREGVSIRTDLYGVGDELTSHPRALLFMALAGQGKVDAIEEIVLDLLSQTPHPRWNDAAIEIVPHAARKLAVAGNTKTALLLLEQLARAGRFKLDAVRTDPAFATLRETDEFRRLVKEMSK
jgi:hypothetical protein